MWAALTRPKRTGLCAARGRGRPLKRRGGVRGHGSYQEALGVTCRCPDWRLTRFLSCQKSESGSLAP